MLWGKWNGNGVEGRGMNVCVWVGSLPSLSLTVCQCQRRQEPNPISPLRSHVCPLSHPSNFSWSVTLIIILTATLSKVTRRGSGRARKPPGSLSLSLPDAWLIPPTHSHWGLLILINSTNKMTWRNTGSWDCKWVQSHQKPISLLYK